jgi:hypothetical protein
MVRSREWDSNIDLRQIEKFGSGFCSLSNCVVDLSVFEGGDQIDVYMIDSAQLHRLCDGGLEIGWKVLGHFDQDKGCEIVRLYT